MTASVDNQSLAPSLGPGQPAQSPHTYLGAPGTHPEASARGWAPRPTSGWRQHAPVTTPSPATHLPGIEDLEACE